MHRCFTLLAAVGATIQLGCSSAKPPVSTIAVTPVAAAKPPVWVLIHGTANVLGGGDEKVPFTLELPPGWTWSGGQAEKIISTEQTIVLSVTARELPDDEKGEKSAAAARRRLVELPDEKML